MKKTLIASAIAAVVAAPAVSFADVSISGNVIQEFVSDGDDTATKEDGLESKAAVDLVFSVSEDLGNGMSAFAKIHTLRDNGGSGNADQTVGLKGDFGTIVAGRMEDFSESKVSALAATDSSDALSIETNRTYKTGRSEGGLAYVSPSFNGLTFGVAGYAMANGGKTSGTVSTITTITNLHNASSATTGVTTVSAATATITAADTNNLDATANFDATDIMVEYANGPLLVRVARENIDANALNSTENVDQTTVTVGASYKMGDITLNAVHYDVDNGKGKAANQADGWFVGAKMAMGANTFGIGYSEETDTDTSGDVQATSGTQTDDKNWLVSVDHALSKRTSITAAFESNDDGTAATADNDRWAVGLKHVF
jgi:predicted porin